MRSFNLLKKIPFFPFGYVKWVRETIHSTSRSIVMKRNLFEELLHAQNQEAVKFECKWFGCEPLTQHLNPELLES